MAHVVLEAELDAARTDHAPLGRVEVVSAGTAGWHEGGPMDRRAAATLTGHGYDASRHRAQQFAPGWFDDLDLVLAMDEANLADLAGLAEDVGLEEPGRVQLFRAFDPLATDGDREVPDPYYGDDAGFEHVLRMVQRTAEHLVAALAEELDRSSAG